MKKITPEEFRRRIDGCTYEIHTQYKDNRNRAAIMRNGKSLDNATMTDYDVILISQLIDQLAEAFHRELCERDLLPDELRNAVEGNLPPKPQGEA